MVSLRRGLTFSAIPAPALASGGSALRFPDAPARQPRGGIFYGWWLVIITGIVMIIATVPLFHAMSVWAVALERQFGWSRAQLGIALTLTRVESGIIGPIEGYLVDRVGTRRMVLIGLAILGGAYLFFSQINSLWTFYVAYILMAVGQGLGSWIPLMTMLNKWFSRRRSSAIGWANVVSRFGALLLVPGIAWAVADAPGRIGWQTTALIIGIGILILAAPLAGLIRNDPRDYGALPDGETPRPNPTAGAAARAPRQQDLTAAQALRTPAFWLIAFGHGFTSMVILAIMAHLGLLMVDKGYTEQDAGWVISAYTGVAMVFQLVGGYTGDRMSKRIALAFFTTLQAGGVLVLVIAQTLPMFFLFGILFGAGFGGRNPLTVAIRADYFGTGSFGKILGFSTVPMNLLLLIAAPFAGWMSDRYGNYDLAFLILAALNLVGALCFLAANRPRPAAATATLR